MDHRLFDPLVSSSDVRAATGMVWYCMVGYGVRESFKS